MASAAVIEKNLAKLDAVMRKTTVLVAPADRRILRTKTVVKGRSWPLKLRGLRPPSEASSSSSGTARSPSEGPNPSSTTASERAGKLTVEDFKGNWIDADGNSVQVAEANKFGVFHQMVATIPRPPLRQLRLELWQPEGTTEWRCGSAVLCAHASSEQLIWRFPGGRVSTWLRQAAFGEGLSDQAWLAVWDPEYGYGPWGLASPAVEKTMSFRDVARMLSGGATDQMMTTKVQEDGALVLVPLTESNLQDK
mmetsp:Transcript_18224/g.31802  ORF Transcript_18224/g.31802 Transcript_18224/m.31802 type:complete len:251 (-) Transcript_18224:43-795(-)